MYTVMMARFISIEDVIASPTTGNVIGIFSLMVGIASLIWTGITYRMTKKIEKKLPEAQAHAINMLHFKEYKVEAIKTLERESKAVANVEKLSHVTQNKLVTICNNILKYRSIFHPEDKTAIEALYERTKKLANSESNDSKGDVIEFIEITSELVGILQKGEYDI